MEEDPLPGREGTRRAGCALGLFVAAMLIYAATRLIGLAEFPIYFFSDEAIQAVSAADLIRDGFRNSDGLLWPPYFKNYAVWNLGLSVYLQLLPVRLLGMSVFVTRLVSVWVGLLGMAAVAGTLRHVFRARGWYLSVLVLAATPAWFLHSRTAFETAEMVAFYALFIYCYLLYRTRSPRYIYAALVFAAAAFYSYSNGQAIIGLLALALAVVDAPYHWRVARGGGREKGRKGEREKGREGVGEHAAPLLPFSPAPLLLFLALAALLAWPYLRFRMTYPTDLSYHLRSLNSYWFNDISLGEKLAEFGSRYLDGLSPGYWFRPNEQDLIRHRMGESLGHMRLLFLPFLLLGIVVAVGRGWWGRRGEGEKGRRGEREQVRRGEFFTLSPFPPFSPSPEERAPQPAAYRVVLLALLAAPVGAALVDVAITRVLSVVVPATLLIGIGMDWLLGQLTADRRRPTAAQTTNDERRTTNLETRSSPATRYSPLATRLNYMAFILLALMSLGTLRYALADGPRWYGDYAMGGMQYGAAQLFAIIEERLAADPTTEIILTPNWANGTDMFPRFFLSAEQQRRVRTINVDAFLAEPRTLTPNMLFIMLPDEVERAQASPKFAEVTVEGTVAYPDGRPGFLLARLAYAPNVEEVFAAELEALRQPVTDSITLDGQAVAVTHTRFEAGQIGDLFDGDTFTLVRHIAGNPVRYEFVFETPRPVGGLAADFGTMDMALTVTLTPPDGEPVIVAQEFRGLGGDPHVDMPFPGAPPLVASMTLEIRDLNAGEDVKIHVRELRMTN